MFIDPVDYHHFLRLFYRYLDFWLDLYAYSLLPNHFHLFARVKEIVEKECDADIVNQFRKFFITYSQYLNLKRKMHGEVFCTPFRRILIENDFRFTQVIYYIHANAVHHKLCEHISKYPYSSYHTILSFAPTRVNRKEVLEWFGGRDSFIKAHDVMNAQFRA